jgi:hypothetical protein
LEIYHKPNPKIKAILAYLRLKNVKFCTDPKKKEEDYYSSVRKPDDSTDLGL